MLRIIAEELIEYNTPKIVHIKSKFVGLLNRLIQLTLFAYIVGYVIVFQRGYQRTGGIESAVTTKVKGVVFTNFSDDDFSIEIPPENIPYYHRIWDVADYVVPPSENGAFFVTTNVIITPNQTQGICPEDPLVFDAVCDPDNNHCKEGEPMSLGNGVMTGRCVESAVNKTVYTCEINAWCPVEHGVNPLKNGSAILAQSKTFTVLIKNNIEFPDFKKKRKNIIRKNVPDNVPNRTTYLKSCHYHPETDKLCPVFVLGDIVQWANQDYDLLAVEGGVVAIVINWNCDLDYNPMDCNPTYSFRRLDDPEAVLSKGWNFRHAHFHNDTHRTLYKVFGIRFIVLVYGKGGQFDVIPLFMNVGSGLGLLAIATVISDIVVLYMTKKREFYKANKYQTVDPNTLENNEEIKSPTVVKRTYHSINSQNKGYNSLEED